MAGKCKEMNKIKQALRLHLDGETNRSIGRKLDLYKGTVNKYVNMAKACGIPIPELLAMEEPEIERVLTGGSPAYSDSRFQDLKDRLQYIAAELQRKHVTMYLLWREYRTEMPDGYGYTQFCYHVNQFTEAQKPSFVLSPDREGGQYLFVDFAGDTLSYVDLDTGEAVKCQVFVATLPASDYGFAMAVPSQKVDDFLYAMECCLRHIGGVPKIIVTDNLKSAVVKADRYEPEVNRSLEDFAEHFGCVTIPARSGKPKDKALVENHVKLTYHDVYAPLRNRQFFSIDELNRAIAEQMTLHNQRRMQRLPFTREERFISIDKPALKPLRAERFEIKYRCELLVNANSFVYMGRSKNYYSVPYRLIGQKVRVIYTRTMVFIYSRQGEKVATHNRSYRTGEYVCDKSHLPSYYNDYVSLSPSKYIQRAERVSTQFGEVIRGVFGQNTSVPPETYYKSCDGLFSLQRTTDPDLFERACAAALERHRCNYGFIKNLIGSKCAGLLAESGEPVLFPADHENIRGREYFF
ncbi:MAG: IS21 family transposase [Bacteroidales bacterium]|nr:IS21 family transposase [Bacteroidales bacterium]